MGQPIIPCGIYPLSVEQNRIKFRIGRKRYSIYTDYFMNHEKVPLSCLELEDRRKQIYLLKSCPSNRFALGNYAETEIIIHFNHVEVKSRG